VSKHGPNDDPKLLPPGKRIVVPQEIKEILVGPDGTLSGDGQPLGKLKLVRFDTQEDALREGLTLFTNQPGKNPKEVDPNTSVEQGYLESANVNAVSGMNELINVSRSFEALEKVIDTFRQLDDRTARDVGGKV
jgi:flagellar basal body rod protein FlgG